MRRIRNSARYAQISDQRNKLSEFYRLLIRWICIKQTGHEIVEYFEDHAYKRISVYGMKELGERLIDDLELADLEVVNIIDRDYRKTNCKYKIVKPDETIDKTDVIVVTAIHYFDEIAKELDLKVDCPIVNMDDIVYEIYAKYR